MLTHRKKNIIVVLGFGRSGTTWISDIISKVSGHLILFEPIHPQVTYLAEKLAYASVTDNGSSDLLRYFYAEVMNKRNRAKWLMRNHVPDRLDKISDSFLHTLWEQCHIIGFKEIRANFLMEWYLEHLGARIVFIIRHPCATVASIKVRQNFWEFGWPDTYNLFLEKTIYNQHYQDHPLRRGLGVVREARTQVEQYAVMWAITHAIALPELARLGLPLFHYEEFYDQPFSSTKALFNYLGNAQVHIHPSYLFTPSMTTLKTVHGLGSMEKNLAKKGVAFFWEERLTEAEVERVMEIVRAFGITLYEEEGWWQHLPSPPPAPAQAQLGSPLWS